MTPEPYTPTPGGRYHIGEDGKRVRQDDAPSLPPAAPAPAPADPEPTPAIPVVAPKKPATKE